MHYEILNPGVLRLIVKRITGIVISFVAHSCGALEFVMFTP